MEFSSFCESRVIIEFQDDIPAPDDPSRTCDVLQRQLAISESSQNSNDTDINESVTKDNAATVKDSDKLCTNQKVSKLSSAHRPLQKGEYQL